jgi:dTDP-4-amino-4,6-dideoxygalactose transaminase
MSKLPFSRPSIGECEISAVREVLESGWLASGPKVLKLESALEEFIGGGVQVRLFNSATSALEATLLALDIGPGDEVIVPAMSFVASANVVVRTGATPVFVDVELHSRNINVEGVEAALTPSTRAVIPVHFAGLPVELEPLRDLAVHHDLLIVEDAAQAIGSQYQGHDIGSWGNPVSFSFHPNKNMTTIEGGALATSDATLIKRLESIRFHGMARDDEGEVLVEEWGGKMNLSDVCAAVGLEQLPRLAGFNVRRRTLAQQYFDSLPEHASLVLPSDREGHSWHMFCVCLDTATLGITTARVRQFFDERGISLGMHYPAIHLFPLYRRYGYGEGDFPVAERIGAQTFTLPLFPAMTGSDVARVCDTFEDLFRTFPS